MSLSGQDADDFFRILCGKIVFRVSVDGFDNERKRPRPSKSEINANWVSERTISFIVWNFERVGSQDWCNSTTIGTRGLRRGIGLVMF